MPFTFSHPALVLPLTYLPSKWFSLTGLVIGSLIPDFEYFIRMRIQSNYSHTLFGLFWFDLPIGLLLAFVYHIIVRNSLFDNLPTLLKSRLSVFKQFDWNMYFKKKWFVVIISILIGTVSHLLWDSFTHCDGYFVQTLPFLTSTVEFFGRHITAFKIIQHSSTLLGGIVIVWAIFRLQRDKNVIGHLRIKYWSVLLGLTCIIIAVRLICGLDYRLYGHVIVTGISAGLIALILTPLLIKKRI